MSPELDIVPGKIDVGPINFCCSGFDKMEVIRGLSAFPAFALRTLVLPPLSMSALGLREDTGVRCGRFAKMGLNLI